jgi:tetratricopeptide (TPR) repeat protein
MMLVRPLAILASLLVSLAAAGVRQSVDDPQLQAAVQQFFALQEAEDLEGYLALWSRSARRPTAEQVKFVFDSGDDKFTDIVIVNAAPAGERVSVRVSVARERTSPPRVPGGPPRTFKATSSWSLVFVREGTEWKLFKEGPAIDALADALLEASTQEERETLLAANLDLVNDQLVVALSRPGAQASQQGMHKAAQAAYELMRDVARRVGNSKLEGEALQNLANALYFQRNFAGALHAYEERLALERSRDDQEGIAGSLLGIATIRYALADYASALTTYRAALAIQEKLGDEGVVPTTLISIGNVLYLQGDFAGAIADYTRSRDMNRRTGNFIGEADALEGLGRVLVAQGDYLAALDAFSGVLREATVANNHNDQGSALLSIGDIHFRLGNFEAARTALDQSRTHFEAIKHLANAGRAWQALALADLASGRYTLAEGEYRKSAASCASGGDQDCAAAATVGLAFAQTAQDKFPEGIASYRKGIEAFTTLERSREQAARAEVGLSHALIGAGEPAAALDAAVRARGAAEKLANDDVLWRALVAEARALRRLRERPRAIGSAGAAVSAVARLVEAARLRPSAPVSRDSSSAFAMLALLQGEDGDAAAAFETIERMRAHDLRVVLAPVEREISRGMTDAEREEERTLAGQIVSLHAQLTRERMLPKPDEARIARLERSAADAGATREAQQQRLFERLPDLRIWRGLAPAATRADAADLLTDRSTVLVQLVVGEDVLLVVVARRGDAGVIFTTHFEAASRRDIADRVAKLTHQTTLRDPKAWTVAGLSFVPGLTAVFGSATRAIVIPHEMLWRVPFEALPTGSGYLADTTSIVYAQSVSALVRVPKRAAGPAAPPLLVAASAAPLGKDVADRIAETAPGWTLRTPESARLEIEIVAGREPDPTRTVVLDGALATEASVRERIAAASVLHLAAPFRINGASPLFSPFLFAPDPANDAVLDAREIMNLDLRASLAVFSDDAAMSMRDAAGEASTVAWAWRAAGVPSILVARWVGEPAVSNQLLGAFHARLRAGDAPEAALQSARRTLRDGTPAPYHWSAWMLIGQ